MPVYETYKRELCWGIWKMDETVEELASLIPSGERLFQEAMQLFANECRRKEWLTVRVLLYYLSGKEMEIAYYPSGKPYLREIPCHISISHTKGYVAVALHSRKEVGIDIEQYSTRVERVKERFMREDENAEGDEIYALLLHWSAKETLFKLLGKEEVDFKKHLRILPFTVTPEGVMKACEYKTKEQRQYLLHYQVEDDFVLTWCMEGDETISK